MKIQLNSLLVYDTALSFEQQEPAVQAYINEIAFDYANAASESEFEGTGELGQPIRYRKLVHLIVGDVASLKTTVNWQYENTYGHQAAWKGTFSLELEVINE